MTTSPPPPKLVKLFDNGILPICYDITYFYACICYNLICVWFYAISAAMWMFGLDNEEQHIFTFCAFINQKLHQYAGKAFDRITTSVGP